MQGRQLLFHKEVTNTPHAIKTFVKELNMISGFSLSVSVFCMEHTGIYNNHLLSFLHQKQANICLEVASQIKNSMGNVRGKNDKVDSIRIAEYAYKNRETLRFWQPKRDVVQNLANLTASRSRLIVAQKMLKSPLKEAGMFVRKKVLAGNITSRTLKAIEADLKETEKAIIKLISEDPELNRLFNIIKSVQGIGDVTATKILITTNEFKDISSPKKFACYAGIAPFVKESGIFKGKAKVSHMANKQVKCLLHMSALVAIAHNKDLKEFYERKVNEGKNKMSVINSVRNKLIHRVFASVNQNRKYDKIYTPLLA